MRRRTRKMSKNAANKRPSPCNRNQTANHQTLPNCAPIIQLRNPSWQASLRSPCNRKLQPPSSPKLRAHHPPAQPQLASQSEVTLQSKSDSSNHQALSKLRAHRPTTQLQLASQSEVTLQSKSDSTNHHPLSSSSSSSQTARPSSNCETPAGQPF